MAHWTMHNVMHTTYGTQQHRQMSNVRHNAGIGHTQLQSTLNFVTRGFVARMFLSNCQRRIKYDEKEELKFLESPSHTESHLVSHVAV